MAERRDLDPAPPARRPATAAAAPPAPELGGPGTARGLVQRDPENASAGAAAAGHPDTILRCAIPCAGQCRSSLPPGPAPFHIHARWEPRRACLLTDRSSSQ